MEKNETIKKLEAIASPAPSDWRKQAEWRRDNRDWLRIAGSVALRIFMDNELKSNSRADVMQKLECDEQRASEILRGNADLKISEIVKLIGLDGFFSTMEGLHKYVEDKKNEDIEAGMERARNEIADYDGTVLYCRGKGCALAEGCLRCSMYKKDGWFSGIRMVVEEGCIDKGMCRFVDAKNFRIL